jgi:hypothetical protein
MGQKILISEEDKKHIKKLYESEIASPPPNESILVIKDKNPFKYNEYTDARREYSKDLKDGDRFYVFRDFNYYLDSFDSIVRSKLINKTIRFTNADIIIHIISVKRTGDYPNNKVELELSESNSGGFNNIITISKDNYVFKSKYQVDSSAEKDKALYLPNLNKLIEYTQKLISEYDNFYIEKIQNKNDLSTVPDQYFDIREIRRQQTDF